MKLEDGTGSGRLAKVNSDNQLETIAVVASEMEFESERHGDAFVLASGDFIAISTLNTETGILHVKNTSSTKNLYIHSIRSCGTQIQKWKLYKNSDAGTLITDEAAGSSSPLNLTSTKTIEANVYKGANGKTVSGGTMLEHWVNDVGHSQEEFEGALILGNGDSIELSVELATAGDICCRVIGYYK